MSSFARSLAYLAVSSFLTKNLKDEHTLLLGLSGGPDSLLLLHLLLDYQKSRPFHFAIAHVDHGWRAESAKEAEVISHLAKKLNVPFYCKQLNKEDMKGNLEAACRLERLHFFRELCRSHGYHATLLGHHADDLSETVLKRLFEGGNLARLSGMRPCQMVEGVMLWRPLLALKKIEILKEVEKRDLKPFIDQTNTSKKYLRGRMRQELFPVLSKIYGKNLSSSLVRLSSESLQLEQLLQELAEPLFLRKKEGPFGIWYDLSLDLPKNPLVIKFFLKKIIEDQQGFLSYVQLDQIIEFIIEKKANRKILSGTISLIIDRGHLFFLTKKIVVSCWKITATKKAFFSKAPFPTWKTLWSGKGSFWLPKGHYELISPDLCPLLKERIAKEKIPVFLRNSLPFLKDAGGQVYPLLSCKAFKDCYEGEEGVNLLIHYNPMAAQISAAS